MLLVVMLDFRTARAMTTPRICIQNFSAGYKSATAHFDRKLAIEEGCGGYCLVTVGKFLESIYNNTFNYISIPSWKMRE
jgi:hypothetical protein